MSDDHASPRLPEVQSPPGGRATARDLLVIVLLTAPVLWIGLGNHHFWLVDEPFVAEVAREMHASGDFLVPRLNGEPFLEKPPLHYAAVALAYRFLGVTPLAARLPSAGAGLLTLVATYFLGRRLLGRRAGLWGALLLPTFYLFFYLTHYCLVDATLVLVTTAGFLAGSYAFGEDARRWAVPAVYAATIAAFLAKGFVGPAMIAIGLLAFSLWSRDATLLRARGHAAGMLALGAVVAGWGAALYRAGGGAFLREAYLANSVGRIFAITSLVPQHDDLITHAVSAPALLYGLLGNIVPWTPAFLWAILPARLRGARPARGRAFLGAALLANLAALLLAHNKRGMYLLPLYPLMALLVAGEADEFCLAGERAPLASRRLLGIQGVLTSLLVLATAASPLVVNRFVLEEPPRPGDPLLVGALAAAALASIALAVRFSTRRAHAALMATLWGQGAACFAIGALVLFPRADAQKSFARFFAESRAIAAQRDIVPYLSLHNEAYTGLAALAFERPLPVAAGRGALRDEFLRSPDLFVIAPHPYATMQDTDGTRTEILAQQVIAGPMGARSLYFLRLSAAPPPAMTGSAGAAGGGGDDLAARARRLHEESIVVDTHQDVPYKLEETWADIGRRGATPHVDIPRLRAGGVTAPFFAVYVPGSFAESGGAAREALDLIDMVERVVAAHPDDLTRADSVADIRRAKQQGKIAVLMGIEGGHAIEDSLGALRDFHRLGARYMTLTHTNTNHWADSSGRFYLPDFNPEEYRVHHGLTGFGRAVVREMNRLGMMVDVSHVSDETIDAVLAASRAPVFASHSSCRALSNIPRNLTDDQIRRIAAGGGVVMVNVSSYFLDQKVVDQMSEALKAARPEYERIKKENAADPKKRDAAIEALFKTLPRPRASWTRAVDHLERVMRVAGPDAVGLGTDFDGIEDPPEGLDDVEALPRLTEELLRRGHSPEEVRKVLGENFLRFFAKVEATARSLASEAPSTAVIGAD